MQERALARESRRGAAPTRNLWRYENLVGAAPRRDNCGVTSHANPWPDFNAIPTDRYLAKRATLAEAFRAVRAHSRHLTSWHSEAEHQLQSMPDASPAKWHLAHTTWFFETFVLKPFKPGFEWFDAHYCYLFNSYYNAIGSQYPRPKRGLISHPDLAGVWDYRGHVDGDMERLLEKSDDEAFAKIAPILVLGLNHEQQHQELIRTDSKHGLYQSAITIGDQRKNGPTDPGLPAESATGGRKENGPMASGRPANSGSGHFYSDPKIEWLRFEGDKAEIGYPGEGFCFDNELARHAVLLRPFGISSRLATAGEWLAFMEDGGYENPLLWLSDGWFWRRDNDVTAPLYWREIDGQWHRFCWSGAGERSRDASPGGSESGGEAVERDSAANFGCDASPGTVGAAPRRDPVAAWTPIDPAEPVRHVSYYEADAFAEWRGARLPREAEWEAFVTHNDNALHDRGMAWEWTQSAYSAYPGFKPTPGLAGEYNGKFMVNQMVLRGASPATSPFHSRPSYRNFFYPDARWQYTGVRLARDL